MVFKVCHFPALFEMSSKNKKEHRKIIRKYVFTCQKSEIRILLLTHTHHTSINEAIRLLNLLLHSQKPKRVFTDVAAAAKK